MNLMLFNFGDTVGTILSVLAAIAVLLVLITVHEFGHYVSGKIFKFGIKEFAIGFGPAIFKKKKKNGEIFSIRALPLGGYCSFEGEDEDASSPSAFNNKSPYKRIIVLISGAIMNILIALFFAYLLFGIYGQPTFKVYQLLETNGEYVNPLEENDVFVSLNNRRIYTVSDFLNAVKGKLSGQEVAAVVLRDGEEKTLTLKLEKDADFKNIEDTDTLLQSLGVQSMYSTTIKCNFFETIGRGTEFCFRIGGIIFTVLGELLTGKLALTSIGGTITTIKTTADAVRAGGLSYLLLMAAYIGVNLGVFNLLPIPALDGSRVVFTAIEWIRGKPVNRKAEGIIHLCGIIVLLLFALTVDLLHIL